MCKGDNMNSQLKKCFILTTSRLDFITKKIALLLSKRNTVEIIENADQLAKDQVEEILRNGDIIVIDRCTRTALNVVRSSTALYKKIILRIEHSNVLFLDKFFRNKDWFYVDMLISKNEDYLAYFKSIFPELETLSIPLNFSKVEFLGKSTVKQTKNRRIAVVPGFEDSVGLKIALDVIRQLYFENPEFEFFILGNFENSVYTTYISDSLKNLDNSKIHFSNMEEIHIQNWFEDKDFLIYTSIFSADLYYVSLALAKGVIPFVYHFSKADEIFNKDLLFRSPVTLQKNLINSIKNDWETIIKELTQEINKKYFLQNIIDKLLSRDLKKEKIKLQEVIKTLNEPQNFEPIPEITVLTPHYNRTKFLIEDLNLGHKMGSQPKIIVDDGSGEIEKEKLSQLGELRNDYNIKKIIFQSEHKGTVSTYNRLYKELETQYAIACGDDDKILVLDRDKLCDEIKLLEKDYFAVAPRYFVYWYINENRVHIFSDRKEYHNVTGKDILKFYLENYTFDTLVVSIFKTEDLKSKNIPEPFLFVDDYVKYVQILSKNLDRKLYISENFLWVGRKHGTNVSNRFENIVFSESFLCYITACYYGLLSGILSSKTEVLERIYLWRSYSIADELIKHTILFLYNQISVEDFAKVCLRYIPKNEIDLQSFSNEILQLRTMFNSL